MSDSSSGFGNRTWMWIVALILVGLACGCIGLAVGGLVGYLIGRGPGTPAPTRPPSGAPWLGVRVIHEADGARVLEVLPGSPAEEAGLRPSDRITAVNGELVNDRHPLPDLLRRYRPGDTVRLTVVRDGEERTVSVTLGRAP
ncbi:S1C family serine protease [Thermoflexus sp.]|uniref:S1C family serine protease n=1 Tax=Thermoflexus sp. TaxID=1969742 RepID=UPI0017572F51|nr:PDZ domain-containing protein [Thermoflexus sp.]